MNDTRLIWKVRSIKPYPDAHNHLMIGQVVERSPAIRMVGISPHFS